MNTISKWFLVIASLFVVFLATFLIVYEQPKSQANQPASLKLDMPLIEKADVENDLAFIESGYFEEVSVEGNANSRIDLLREYLLAGINVDEYNFQQLYEGKDTLSNEQAWDLEQIFVVLYRSGIESDTTNFFQAQKDYEAALDDYEYLIVSPDEKVTLEEQKEIEQAQKEFEEKSQALISVVDQFYLE